MPSVHKVQFARPKGSGPEGHPVQRFPTVLLDKAELVELKRTLPKGERGGARSSWCCLGA